MHPIDTFPPFEVQDNFPLKIHGQSFLGESQEVHLILLGKEGPKNGFLIFWIEGFVCSRGKAEFSAF